MLQVSGLKYTWDLSDAAGTGNAIVGDVMVDADRNGSYESVLNDATTYRVVVNSFLSDGGDGFAHAGEGCQQVLRRPRHRQPRDVPHGEQPVRPERAGPDQRQSLTAVTGSA